MHKLAGFILPKLARTIAYNPPIQGSKVLASVADAIKDIHSGASIAVGGYGPCGIPQTLINALAKHNTKNHTIVVSTAGGSNYGITPLVKAKKVDSIVTSDLESNEEVIRQYQAGDLKLQLTPMGTIAEKLRSGGMGVPAFYSPIGVGTMIEDGGIPSKLHKGGKSVEQVSDAKEKRQFHEQDFLLERTIQSDFSFVKAWKSDHKGNCIFKKCGINFNPDVGSAGKICIVEADEIVETGVIDGEDVEFGGIFVHRVVKSEVHPQPIFKKIKESDLLGAGEIKNKRIKIVKRAAQEIKDGMYVHLANGYAAILKDYLRKDINVDLFTESGVFGYGKEMKNADINLLDGNMNFISLKKGASITKASDSFSALRGSHLSLIVTEGYQVSQNGDIANWSKKTELMSPKALFDATSANTPLIVLMEHVNAEGRSNIVKECTYNLTGTKCVSKIITDMAVFEFKDDELVLTEISPDVSMEDVKRATDAKFRVEKCYSKINLH